MRRREIPIRPEQCKLAHIAEREGVMRSQLLNIKKYQAKYCMINIKTLTLLSK